jgi:hypothetical protein
MQKKFLFVCGCPRSGTSYFHSLLAPHPAIALGLERFNLRMFERRLMPADFERSRFLRMEAGDTWYDDLSMFPWQQQLVEAHYDTAEYVGDKVPRAYQFFDHLITLFPDVRFICLVRNVFDVAASYETRQRDVAHWDPDWGPRKAVEHWNASLQAILACADVAPILPVVYEDLIANDSTLDTVAEFLDIDPRPLRVGWRQMSRHAEQPEPGAGARRLTSEDVAFIAVAADQDALVRVMQLARRPVSYRGAWQTLGPPPPCVSKYFDEDVRAFVYDRSRPEGSRVDLRNPPAAYKTHEPYIACVGSAATFGRLVARPFPTLLQERLGMPVINLGVGGARPGIFVDEEALARLIRGAACVVVEAMSARGYATDFFVPNHDYTNMGRLPTTEPGGEAPATSEFVDIVYRRPLLDHDAAGLAAARMICRAAYIRDMKRVAALTAGRAVLFYFSSRPPVFTPNPQADTFEAWAGRFPHHVDTRVLDLLAPLFGAAVAVASAAGSPEPIHDRDTGAPLPLFPGMPRPHENFYYPSAAMHALAADALEPVVRSRLGG